MKNLTADQADAIQELWRKCQNIERLIKKRKKQESCVEYSATVSAEYYKWSLLM